MGTPSLDRFGNMAIGYNVSSASTFPSLRVAARLTTDPPSRCFQIPEVCCEARSPCWGG
jgi:hypothetical protein